MCCDNMADNTVVHGECSDCGAYVNVYGEAVMQCAYSSEDCDKCGSRPCDGSC